MSDTYRAELSQFGVDVVLVEPSGFKTTWLDHLVRPADTVALAGYGAFAEAPEQTLKAIDAMLDTKPEQDPAKVANAIRILVDLLAGQRPVRTVVDFVGMAEPVQAMNATLAESTAAVYRAFGSEGLLSLKL
ncbi:hypothetical protein [Mesorhizobium sp. CAU 1732]|uniref:hypothetical protein n=1 Tax=Mesorhizobium sp. CAU 1732 TaxID=3140358 RepID=UPI003261C20F